MVFPADGREVLRVHGEQFQPLKEATGQDGARCGFDSLARHPGWDGVRKRIDGREAGEGRARIVSTCTTWTLPPRSLSHTVRHLPAKKHHQVLP